MLVVAIVRHCHSLHHAPVRPLQLVVLAGGILRVAVVHMLVLAHDLVVRVMVRMVVLEVLLVAAGLVVFYVFDDHVLKCTSQRNLSRCQLVMVVLLFELSRKMLLVHMRPLLQD